MSEQDNSDVAMQFSISHKEKRTLETWLMEHEKKCRYWVENAPRPICPSPDSPLVYIFQPSAIATFCTVRCRCGEEVNITDYDSV